MLNSNESYEVKVPNSIKLEWTTNVCEKIEDEALTTNQLSENVTIETREVSEVGIGMWQLACGRAVPTPGLR